MPVRIIGATEGRTSNMFLSFHCHASISGVERDACTSSETVALRLCTFQIYTSWCFAKALERTRIAAYVDGHAGLHNASNI